jgi:hypothetical protein
MARSNRAEARLRRALERIVLAVLAPAAATAAGVASCTSKSATEAPPTSGSDAAVIDDARSMALDGPEASDPCAPTPIDGSMIDPDAGGCADFVVLPCGLPSTATIRNGCFVDLATCWDRCPSDLTFNCQLAPNVCGEAGAFPDAQTIFECATCPGGAGRRPMGLVPARPARASSTLGAYFASLFHLEAASVTGFRDLERRLARFGAPTRLRTAASVAAEDERRHARAMGHLARRYGGRPERPRVRPRPEPNFVELLEDNAIEGCVGETYGALLALAQSRRATDPGIRRAMARIAADETRHAALAWEIARWGWRRLSDRERRRVGRALRSALAALELRAARTSDAALVDALRPVVADFTRNVLPQARSPRTSGASRGRRTRTDGSRTACSSRNRSASRA